MIYIMRVSEVRLDDVRLLSDYRREKAISKKQESSQLQSIAAGLLLSHALADMGLHERDMEYCENPHGKPYFKNHSEIKFSLSHSAEYAVCTISENDTGVDVETIENGADVLKIAKRYFTKNECERIVKAGDSKREFFRIWTRKESLLKALGTGISARLGKYEVLADSVEAEGKKFYFSDFEIGDSKTSCCTEGKKDGDIKMLTRSDLVRE